MTGADWVSLVAILLPLLGGGAVGTAKLTRIAVATEQLGEALKELASQQQATAKTVQDHENRLNKGGLLQAPEPAVAEVHQADPAGQGKRERGHRDDDASVIGHAVKPTRWRPATGGAT